MQITGIEHSRAMMAAKALDRSVPGLLEASMAGAECVGTVTHRTDFGFYSE